MKQTSYTLSESKSSTNLNTSQPLPFSRNQSTQLLQSYHLHNSGSLIKEKLYDPEYKSGFPKLYSFDTTVMTIKKDRKSLGKFSFRNSSLINLNNNSLNKQSTQASKRVHEQNRRLIEENSYLRNKNKRVLEMWQCRQSEVHKLLARLEELQKAKSREKNVDNQRSSYRQLSVQNIRVLNNVNSFHFFQNINNAQNVGIVCSTNNMIFDKGNAIPASKTVRPVNSMIDNKTTSRQMLVNKQVQRRVEQMKMDIERLSGENMSLKDRLRQMQTSVIRYQEQRKLKNSEQRVNTVKQQQSVKLQVTSNTQENINKQIGNSEQHQEFQVEQRHKLQLQRYGLQLVRVRQELAISQKLNQQYKAQIQTLQFDVKESNLNIQHLNQTIEQLRQQNNKQQQENLLQLRQIEQTQLQLPQQKGQKEPQQQLQDCQEVPSLKQSKHQELQLLDNGENKQQQVQNQLQQGRLRLRIVILLNEIQRLNRKQQILVNKAQKVNQYLVKAQNHIEYIQQHHKIYIQSLKQEYDSIQQQYKKQLKSLNQKQQIQMQSIKQGHDTQMQSLQQNHKNKIKYIQQQHKGQITSIESFYKNEINKLRQLHQAEQQLRRNQQFMHQIEENQERTKELQHVIKEKEGRIKGLLIVIQEIQGRMKMLQSQIESKEKEILGIRHEMGEELRSMKHKVEQKEQQRDRDQLSIQRDQLSRQKDQLQSQRNKLLDRASEGENRLSEAQDRVNELQNRLSFIDGNNKKLLEQIIIANGRCQQLQGCLQNAQNFIFQLQRKLKTCQETLASPQNPTQPQQSHPKKFTVHHAQKELQVHHRYNELQTGKHILKTIILLEEINRLNDKVTKLQLSYQQQSLRVRQLEIDLQEKKQQSKLNLQNLITAENYIEDCELNINQMNSTILTLNAKIEQLYMIIEDRNQRIVQLESKGIMREEGGNIKENQPQGLLNQNRERLQHSYHEQQLLKLRAQVNSYIKKSIELQESLVTAQNHIQFLQTQLHQQNQSNQELQRQRTVQQHNRGSVNEKDIKLEQLNQTINQYSLRMEQQNRTIDQLRVTMNELNQQKQKIYAHLQTAQSYIHHLEEQYHSLTQQHQSLLQKHQQLLLLLQTQQYSQHNYHQLQLTLIDTQQQLNLCLQQLSQHKLQAIFLLQEINRLNYKQQQLCNKIEQKDQEIQNIMNSPQLRQSKIADRQEIHSLTLQKLHYQTELEFVLQHLEQAENYISELLRQNQTYLEERQSLIDSLTTIHSSKLLTSRKQPKLI